MKRLEILVVVVLTALVFTACESAGYKTTASGLKYKLIEGGSKDSTKVGDVLKMHVTQKVSGSKDTLIGDTHGKMPVFIKVQDPTAMFTQAAYSPEELFKQLKKGDSLIVVMFVDSLLKKNLAQEASLPPFLKKGDKITLSFKVLEVFRNDSLANLDYQKEMAKDAPRQQKEQEEMLAKMKKEQEAAQKAEDAALEKSGEKAKQIQAMQTYLAGKKIAATQTAIGTFVKIDNPGTGAQVVNGKFITVKYTGKKISNDSTFDSNQFTVKLGAQPFIRGFEDGLRQFKQGGKGTIYIPGFLAYGKGEGSPFKPYEPLYFNVEITGVNDTDPAAAPQPQPGK